MRRGAQGLVRSRGTVVTFLPVDCPKVLADPVRITGKFPHIVGSVLPVGLAVSCDPDSLFDGRVGAKRVEGRGFSGPRPHYEKVTDAECDQAASA